MIREIKKTVMSGYLMIVLLGAAQLSLGYIIVRAGQTQSFGLLIPAVIVSIVVLICWAGLFMVHPNEAKVLQISL